MSTLRAERIDPSVVRSWQHVEVRRWRNAMFAVFAACGFALAAWVSRTPAVRDGLGASTGHMGWLIFAIAGGAIFGLVSAGALIGRLGARPVIRVALVMAAAGLVVVAAGAGIASSPVVFAGLVVFGLGFGTTDVSMNVAGAANERALGRTVMPIFHATYSIGTLVGAGLGVLAAHLGVPVALHLTVAAVIVLGTAIPAVRRVPSDVGRVSGGQPQLTAAERLAVWRDPRTLLIGLMVLGMGFAEGAAEDWLPLATVDGYGVSETVGAALFGIFVVAMTVGRLCGVVLIDRFGRVATLRVSTAVAAVGLVITIVGPSATTAAAGIALWGLGTSLGLPVGMSAAADDPRTAAARVSAAATVGYAAFLFGPPVLALIGEHVGLLHAFVAVLALVILAGLIAPAARPLTVPAGTSIDPAPEPAAR
ncbi:MAG TPA: MFS transporter [Microlunatus sp.]|nr:MFS transporter [Microlunatus sp.]